MAAGIERVLQSTLARQRKPILRIDLTGVTFIDAAGEACLAAMYHQGAELVAGDCLTKAIVAEIAGLSLSEDSEPTTT